MSAGIQPQSSATAESTTAQATTAHVVESQNGSSADATSTTDVSADKSSRETADRFFAEGNKSLALKKLEEAVAKFADALEVMQELVSEVDPAMAPFLLSYGKALYELALSQSGVMGKEEVQKGTQGQLDAQDEPSNLVESADPEIIAAAEAEAEAEAAAEQDAEEEQEEGEGHGQDEGQAPEGEDDAPEDDFNAAWEVLDVARTIYAKMVEEKKEKQEEYKEEDMRLAECYLFLGDVSCETENFEQAVSDYESALEIQKTHLPAGARSLSSSHFQLGTVMEFLPGRRSDALAHVTSAIEGFRARESQLATAASSSNDDGLIPELVKLTAKEREAELKDTREFIGDLEAKLEELKTAPEQEDIVSQGIKHLLGGSAEGAFASAFGDAPIGSSSAQGASAEAAPVNTLMVKKKKKPAQAPAPSSATGNGVASQVRQAVDGATAAAGEAAQTVVEGVKRTAEEIGQSVEDLAEAAAKKARTE